MMHDCVWAIESRKTNRHVWRRHIPFKKYRETCERRITEFVSRGSQMQYRVVNTRTGEAFDEALARAGGAS